MTTAELTALAKRLEATLGGVEVSPEQKQTIVAALMRTVQNPKSSAADFIKVSSVIINIDRTNLELLKLARDIYARFPMRDLPDHPIDD